MEELLPPKGMSLRKPKNPRAGTAREKLESLGFDPLEELVTTYKRLNTEVALQEGIRDQSIVLLRPDGKATRYNERNHIAALSEQVKLGSNLAEYMYKKAHQETVSDKPLVPITINLGNADTTTSRSVTDTESANGGQDSPVDID